MLLMERAGPVIETQRKCLEEAEKATTRVLGVVERLEILARWDQRPSQAKNAAVVAQGAGRARAREYVGIAYRDGIGRAV
jgi:hypothetical protein